jgi:hypothetical protein
MSRTCTCGDEEDPTRFITRHLNCDAESQRYKYMISIIISRDMTFHHSFYKYTTLNANNMLDISSGLPVIRWKLNFISVFSSRCPGSSIKAEECPAPRNRVWLPTEWNEIPCGDLFCDQETFTTR